MLYLLTIVSKHSHPSLVNPVWLQAKRRDNYVISLGFNPSTFILLYNAIALSPWPFLPHPEISDVHEKTFFFLHLVKDILYIWQLRWEKKNVISHCHIKTRLVFQSKCMDLSSQLRSMNYLGMHILHNWISFKYITYLMWLSM